jgi:hypothetical protein
MPKRRDPEILWGIRTNRLAALKSAVERIRERLER